MIHVIHEIRRAYRGHDIYSLCNESEPKPLLVVEAWDFIAISAATFPGKFKRPELCPECELKLKLYPPAKQGS